MKIEFANIDSMPRETALEFLTNPKQKVSGSFRRQCHAALDRVLVSEMPMTRISDEPSDGYEYNGAQAKRPTDARIAKKMTGLGIVQLGRILTRAIARGEKCRTLAAKPGVIIRLQAMLHEKARAFDTLRDAASIELDNRTVCKNQN